MGREIERKFLIHRDRWTPSATGVRLRQGYVCASPDRTVRVRSAGRVGWITVKGPMVGHSRLEFEYEIPGADADAMIESLCTTVVDKTRYREPFAAHVWEVDVFHGANEGLVVAEVELSAEGEEPERPSWVAEEVTADRRYANSRLAREPYSTW
ncbi:MAG: CYTH domain-containing protein [Acidobacteria bacterium]|nr:CYTH domain-containing protein [Acidobacteriota bacterium]